MPGAQGGGRIDEDHAVPGPRLRDSAQRPTASSATGHLDGLELSRQEQPRRVGVLAEAYGDVSARDVVRWAVLHLEALISWSYA